MPDYKNQTINRIMIKNDVEQLNQKGIPLDILEQQIMNFKKGFPFVTLKAPATTGDGIITLSEETTSEMESFFERNLHNVSALKFVPASGAATRMFSHLFAFRKEYSATIEQISQIKADNDFNSAAWFFKNITQFAFYPELKSTMEANGKNLDKCLQRHDYNTILDLLLYTPGLNYAQLPKALLKFHKYQSHSRTALEEHLVEAAHYITDRNKNTHIHFTLSPEHIHEFEKLLSEKVPYYEKQLGVTYRITHSIQKPSTDTIAVDKNNEPFRNADSTLLFRPGGHGALINNLNEIDADVIFIKNIDNIVPDRLKPETNLYKMVLGGWLLKTRNRVFVYLKMLEQNNLSEKTLNEITSFAKTELFAHFQDEFYSAPKAEKIKRLFALLNRPIRVCGMVKNEGEPGGGPFVVSDADGNMSLQIIESSQVDMQNASQKQIAGRATHFNPVDLVCSIKDHKGNKFDLLQFVDPSTGFISLKTKDGRPLKAQELPGLWNGAMAKWNTIFVEVPISTFNPVKTVNDLLRPEHL